jgi:L-fuconolactonase
MIDAHQHFWQLSKPFDYAWLDDPNLAAIRRDYLPADLKPHLDAAGMQQTKQNNTV